MAAITRPYPVKLICPALSREDKWFKEAEAVLQENYGPVDLTSQTWDFKFTDYYRDEMGSGLKRRIFSFRRLISPADLPSIKVFTNGCEDKLKGKCNNVKGRVVNIDPGYICSSKLVLATTKDYAHRIYLNKGIFAEVTLVWTKNGFSPLDTTYPDYRTGHYRDFFAMVRSLYTTQIG